MEKLSRTSLIQHAHEQLVFLNTSCQLYDLGHLEEAKRIALSLRILFRSKEGEPSIYEALGLDYQFQDTSSEYSVENLLPHNGLVSVRISNNPTQERILYVPLLDSYRRNRSATKNFSEWWKETVVMSEGSDTLTREKLVRLVCNKDGGAHVDLEPTALLRSISNPLNTPLATTINGLQFNFENRKDLASIRQIGYETVQTFSGHLPIS